MLPDLSSETKVGPKGAYGEALSESQWASSCLLPNSKADLPTLYENVECRLSYISQVTEALNGGCDISPLFSTLFYLEPGYD